MDEKNPFSNNNQDQNRGVSSKPAPFKSKESQDLINILSTVGSNLKILEDRYSNLRRKTQLTDQVLIETQRSFSKDKRLINEELLEIKSKIQKLVENLEDMQKELQDTVHASDFLVLKKYVEYWEPLRFVTRKEVDEVLRKR
jgi:hypothetical protein